MTARRGLVLSGGGARGAYEVGVLAYIAEHHGRRFDVFSGTSVGAIHASHLASSASDDDYGIARLKNTWLSMRAQEYLRFNLEDAIRLPADLHDLARGVPVRRGLLVNADAFRRIIVDHISWRRIRENINQGRVTAVTVTATHIDSGATVVFVDDAKRTAPYQSRDPRIRAEPVRLGPTHVLASAAIPVLFPSVRIEGRYYCDGGVRQSTPLSPAIRLGCDRILLIGMRADLGFGAASPEEEVYPGPLVLLGKIMNSLSLDPLDYDLRRLRSFNALMKQGADRFGEDFVAEFETASSDTRGRKYRPIDVLSIQPSRDIGAMATEFLLDKQSALNGLMKWTFGWFGGIDVVARNDVLSYVLFERDFIRSLIELGYRDAKTHEDELAAFFDE